MATKTTGLELKAFYQDEDHWNQADGGEPEEYWHEDVELKVNGELKVEGFEIDQLQDNDRVVIVAGLVMSNIHEATALSFESFFKAWRKKQATVYLSVQAPREKLDSVKAAIQESGGKIL